MKITNKAQLLEFIKKESLKLFNESQAFATIEDKLKDVDEGFVKVNEKRFDKLKGEEEKAIAKEDYPELQRIKEEKVSILGKLIVSYKKKVELLEQIRDGLKQELDELGVKGSGVFKNKSINEFNNEEFLKGQLVKIQTISSETKFEKISDNNQYKIVETNIEGLQPGDVVVLPNIKVGSSVQMPVHRKIGDRFTEIGKPALQNVKGIIKNPS